MVNPTRFNHLLCCRLVRDRLLFPLLFALLFVSEVGEAVDPKNEAAGNLNLLPGFQAECIYNVPRDKQGSWVSLSVDPEGRLIASSQRGHLYRVTPPPKGSRKVAEVEKIDLDIGQAQGLLCAAGSLYVIVNGSSASGSGLYRVRDTDGDDHYDEVKLLRPIEGAGEHGPHGITLGPDGESLYIVGGNLTKIPNPEKSRVPRHWGEDLILPQQSDSRGFSAAIRAPGGWVCRTDLEGKEWELIASGFRNPYDLAFSEQGNLFTYDSDNEWDVGTSWYRPTRICHVVSGGEFGWRTGTGKWPAYQPDSLPASIDIGHGSPTGLVFGTGADFPEKYQRALFVSDWSFGNLYAAHLTAQGGSFTGSVEPFVTAAPLPITDVVVRPQDGMLYFTVGGRGVESALYRVWYAGREDLSTEQNIVREPTPTHQLREQLERFHIPTPSAVEQVWPYLSHPDRHIRFAARIALEHQPIDLWQGRALEETDPRALLTAIIGLTRSRGTVDRELQGKIFESLGRLDPTHLTTGEQIALLRAYALVLIRLGSPDEQLRTMLIGRLNPLYPANDESLNRALCDLLVALGAPEVVSKTLALLRVAQTQEEQIHYILALRLLKEGWTLSERREYFDWFRPGRGHGRGQSFESFMGAIRREAIANLLPEEKQQLGEIITDTFDQGPPPTITNRKRVRDWTVEDLLEPVAAATSGNHFSRGEEMFSVAGCFKCHRVAGRGGIVGPDLTGSGSRFSVRDLLEAIVEPNRVISDQYRATIFSLTDGKVITGHIADLGKNELSIMTDMLRPRDYTKIERTQVEHIQPSLISMMPDGLIDTLTREEIMDLIAYLRSGGDAKHPLFAPAEGR